MLLFCLVLGGYSLQPKKDDQFEMNEEGPAIVKRDAAVDTVTMVMECNKVTVDNITSIQCTEDSGTTLGAENDFCNNTNGTYM